MVMVVVMMVVMACILFPAARLLEGLLEVVVDLGHLLDRRSDIAGHRIMPLIYQGLLPFAVFHGMFFVMIDPVL